MFAPLSADELAAAPVSVASGTTKTPIIPVPADAPAMRFAHPEYGAPSAVWPYHDAAGALIGYAARFDFLDKEGRPAKDVLPLTFCDVVKDGRHSRGWRSKGIPAPRPIYRLPDLLARSDAAILVCEGEKAADAAAGLFPDLVCTTPMHGSKSPHLTNWSVVNGRRVIIWPDHDQAGAAFAAKVDLLCLEAGASEILHVPVPTDFPAGWDVADEAPHGWTSDRLRELMDLAKPVGALTGSTEGEDSIGGGVPNHFIVSESGVYYNDPDPDKQPVHICGRLDVLAQTRDVDGNSWGVLLSWKDSDGRPHEWAMPRSMLAGDGSELRARLLDGGLYVAPGRAAREKLLVYLGTARPNERARCVSRVGWHGRSFVLPDEVFGDAAGERLLLQSSSATEHAFRVRGSLKDWQENVARYAVGNSRLGLSIAAAFAAPLLQPTGSESGGFHLRGPSSVGKSTAMVAAGSVWGGGPLNGFVCQWRATDNGLEAVTLQHCDALLCLDELSQIDARAAGPAAYMLANGSGKVRAGRGGEGRPAAKWRTLFLSNGEIGIADKIAEEGRGRRMAAGQGVRVIDIPADAGAGLGLFETLHGFPDGNALSRHIKGAALEGYGTAARAFLDQLVVRLDQIVAATDGYRQEFIKEHCPDGADGQVYRVAERFGLVAAAGEAATWLGILPWPDGEAARAAGVCFKAWLDARGGAGAAEVSAGIEQVIAFLTAHGSSRFEPIGDNETTPDGLRIINRAGWRRRDDQGRWEYLVSAAGFKEMTSGLDRTLIARALVERGLLLPANDGKRQRSQHIPGVGKVKIYHFPGTAIGEETDHA